MEGINAADILGIVFLGYGIIDGYRKGFVKKGILFGISILTLVLVYMASPYVAEFFRGILPAAFSLENVLGTDSDIYRLLVLSGFGDAIYTSTSVRIEIPNKIPFFTNPFL